MCIRDRQWLGYLERMDDQRMLKKILRAQGYKSGKRGRPRIKWLDDVLEVVRRMDMRVYTERAMDRRHWRRLMLEAKTHIAL